MGEPFDATVGGCGGYEHHAMLPPRQCTKPPTLAGLVYYPHTRNVWWAFACDEHGPLMKAVRLLGVRDLQEIQRRRIAKQAALEGHGWHPPQPLATGARAAEFLAKAERSLDDAAAAAAAVEGGEDAAPRERRRDRRAAARRAARPGSGTPG
jgi:hypothetical protein